VECSVIVLQASMVLFIRPIHLDNADWVLKWIKCDDLSIGL
jgi:hypothetical protein